MTDPSDIDVGALLAAGLEEPPPADFAQRVNRRAAFTETLVELGRLLVRAPLNALIDEDVADRDRGEQDA